MGVLHTDPDNTDSEVRSLQKRVDFLASDKEVFEIRRRNGKVVALSNICTTTIAEGEAHQGLFCIRQHMATQTHKPNLEIPHSTESEIPLAIQTLQREMMSSSRGSLYPERSRLFVVHVTQSYCYHTKPR